MNLQVIFFATILVTCPHLVSINVKVGDVQIPDYHCVIMMTQ